MDGRRCSRGGDESEGSNLSQDRGVQPRARQESDEPISLLRQRMIDDMTARRFKEKVRKDYVRHVRTFAAFLGRSPDTATSEDLRRFQLHMALQQISAGLINAAVAALRFFFNVTLERPDLVRHLTTMNTPCRAPVVLSQEEVARLRSAWHVIGHEEALHPSARDDQAALCLPGGR
jgi:integrase/recombinase XerD